jgi:hypothetical protein
LEEGRRSFNPANSVQVDPNETFRIPIEFQQPTSARNRRDAQVQYSPFLNRTPVATNMRGGPFSMAPPPDSPVIHAQGRLSLKSPSINNFQMNSPFPSGQVQLNSIKKPRRVIKRPPY